MKVVFAVFLYLQLGFVIFWQKNIGAKAACKIVMKLTTALFILSRISRFIKSVKNVFNFAFSETNFLIK